MRLTLTALASQYIHMPLAPFCLKKAVDESLPQVGTTICDLNINDPREDLLARVMATEPDVLGVCMYIWNRDCAASLIRRVKALRPETVVIVGGPEATFSVEKTLLETKADYLLRGAGEESLPALLRCLLEGGGAADVPGCCFLTDEGAHIVPPAPASTAGAGRPPWRAAWPMWRPREAVPSPAPSASPAATATAPCSSCPARRPSPSSSASGRAAATR